MQGQRQQQECHSKYIGLRLKRKTPLFTTRLALSGVSG